jgi:hypothetical protein
MKKAFTIDNFRTRGIIYMQAEIRQKNGCRKSELGILKGRGDRDSTSTNKGGISSWLALFHTVPIYPYGGSLEMLSPRLGKAPQLGVKEV